MEDDHATVRVGRLWRTVRHLKPIQVLWGGRSSALGHLWATWPRLLRRQLRDTARDFGPLRWDGKPLRALAEIRQRRVPLHNSPADAILEDTFHLVNQPTRFEGGVDWHRSDLQVENVLAGFELHYQRYLEDLAQAQAETRDERYLRKWLELTTSWIAANPPADGAVRFSWSPYVISERVRAWLASAHRLKDALDRATRDRLGQSLCEQVAFLAANPERDLQGNHLLQNLCGLAVALSVMDGKRARSQRAAALRQLAKVVRSQVLADGMHEERSFAYHLKCMRDLTEVLAVAEAGGFSCAGAPAEQSIDVLRSAVGTMAGLVADTLNSVGALPLMNDGEVVSAQDAMQAVEEVSRFARPRPRNPKDRLRGSGYMAGSVGPWAAVFDAGRPGPDHQLGHAHADHLSFELWHRGRKLVCDCGNATYQPGEKRQRYRGTAAHNTVRLDGHDSLELWSSFRVGRRPSLCEGRIVRQDGERIEWEGVHDGYAWLPGSPVHRRTFILDARGTTIIDRVDGKGKHSLESFLHLAPEVTLEPCSTSALALPDLASIDLPSGLSDGARVAWTWRLADGPSGWILPLWPRGCQVDVERRPSAYAPRQNVEIPCAALRLVGSVPLPFEFCWVVLVR